MVRSGCPVFLLHLFSVLVQTGGIVHTKCGQNRFNTSASNFQALRLCLSFSASAQDIMYPYGAAHRDLETPKMDDGSSPEITLTIQFVFFSVPYRSIYVTLQTKSTIRARFTLFFSTHFHPTFLITGSVFTVRRSTTMVWSPSTCRSASSHQRLFL